MFAEKKITVLDHLVSLLPDPRKKRYVSELPRTKCFNERWDLYQLSYLDEFILAKQRNEEIKSGTGTRQVVYIKI